ncbi:LysR substrate-binding domain-containing protein [Mesorhizobium sp. A623]
MTSSRICDRTSGGTRRSRPPPFRQSRRSNALDSCGVVAGHGSDRGAGTRNSDSAEAIRDMVVAGFGIAHLPRFLVADDLATGRLVAVLIGHPMREVPISVLYPNRRHLPARVRLFIDRLSQNLEDE